MTIFVNRSIPLSEESRNGWTSAGCVIINRSRRAWPRRLREKDGNVLLNLGTAPNLVGNLHGVVWNSVDSVRSVITPAALRRTIPDLIPPQETETEHWHKGPGQHGENKIRHNHTNMPYGHRHDHQQNGWDVQKHVEGREYRVITVGNVVVQAHEKVRVLEFREGEPFSFVWSWVGVGGIKNNGIIPLVKRAVTLVPNGERTVFGWDVIVGEEGPFIIEANSSMGVNEATARRIVEQIRRTQ